MKKPDAGDWRTLTDDERRRIEEVCGIEVPEDTELQTRLSGELSFWRPGPRIPEYRLFDDPQQEIRASETLLAMWAEGSAVG